MSKGIKNVIAVDKQTRPQPTLSLNEDDLKAIKNWKVGEKHTITLEVEQTEASKGDDYWSDEGSKKLSARFKVLKAHTEEE